MNRLDRPSSLGFIRAVCVERGWGVGHLTVWPHCWKWPGFL